MVGKIGQKGLLLGDMGVYLGGAGAGMSQQFLNHSQVRAPFQHVGSEGMPQGMGMYPQGCLRLDPVAADQLFHAPAR